VLDETPGKNNSSYQSDCRYMSFEGVEGWARVAASLVPGTSSAEPSVSVMVEDITEYKRAEQRLRDAQKMEAVGRLVGGVAHDFNNILTGVMLYCDLLAAELQANARLRHHVEEIRMAGEQGAALVQQLLAIARQQVVEPRILCMNVKIAGTRELLSRLIGENIEFRTEPDPRLGNVRIDPAQFQQILLNLVLNARDAMPAGGQIVVRPANCEFHVSDSVVPATPIPGVMLTVVDDGCGMSAETRSHLFEPFFATKSAGRGNGLGLSTVHDIVQAAGGCLDVESELGRGTAVRVILPRVLDPVKPDASDFHYSPGVVHETILVLEDNLIVRQAVCGVLRECGYSVLEAGNGTEALALAETSETPIDLLLADLVLPGISGRTVAGRLQAKSPGLLCLYMSGYEPKSHALAAETDTVVRFQKPFTGAVLLQKVREMFESRSLASTTSKG
jgi:signal transduction histidine kinase/CheY-like chemotaxis protein